MRNIFILFLILVNCIALLNAQTVIQGQIKFTSGKPANSASVIVKNTVKNTLVGYVFSDVTGNYKLSFNNTNLDSLNIVVSGFNVETTTQRIKNETQTVNFIIHEKELKLKEVTVKEQKVWSGQDTINYLVSAFTDKKDMVIGDVLKKMPGINVDKDGAITWQGKPINTFYIENLDLLRSRYGIATNNVAANDVATVQVLEHHQPVKALEGVLPTQTAAINLKLKDEAKGKFTFIARLGIGGLPVQWEDELAAMSFTKKWQNISTFKGNNSGVDLSSEIKSLGLSSTFDGENMLGIQIPSPPEIDSKRYLFNNSNAITANNIFKTDSDATVNVNVAYLKNLENREGSAITTYYIPGKDNLVISEDMNSRSNTNRLDAGLRYNRNKTKKNIDNSLDISALWDDISCAVTSTQTIHQELKKPTFSATENFSWINKTSESKGFSFYSTIGIKSIPHQLSIFPGMYSDLLNKAANYNLLKQETRINNFNTSNQFTLLSPLSFGNFSISPNLELNGEFRNLTSEILIQDNAGILKTIEADSMKNNLAWTKYNTKFTLPLQYKSNTLNASLSLPFDYNFILIHNKIQGEILNLHRFYFQPKFDVRIHITSKLDITANYRFSNHMGNIMSYYSGYILSDYRSLNRNDSRIYESQTNGEDMGLEYKDIINLLFFGSTVSYYHSKSNLIYGQKFQGILSVSSAVEHENTNAGAGAFAFITKGFDWKRLYINLKTWYNESSFTAFQENELIDYTGRIVSLATTITFKPINILNVEYNNKWNNSLTKLTSSEKRTSYNNWTNNLNLIVDLPNNLIFNVGFEHYFNSTSSVNRNLSFVDTGLTYIWKKIHFSLDWNNIFNTNNYITYYCYGINSYQNNYHIRASNIMLKVKLKIK
jgi:hypothetical protein